MDTAPLIKTASSKVVDEKVATGTLREFITYSYVIQPKLDENIRSLRGVSESVYKADEQIMEIGLTPGSPGTNHYNYRIFADGRVVLPGLNYHVPSYRLTQNQLVTIQNELCMIDIESYSKQIEPAPFVHNGQSRIVGVKFNGGFYRLIYSAGGQAMPQQVDSFIQFVLKTIAKAPPIER